MSLPDDIATPPPPADDLRLNCTDGMEVRFEQIGDTYDIYVQLTLRGEGVHACRVWSSAKSACSLGDALRRKAMVEAICRHLDAMGTYDEVLELARALQQGMSQVVLQPATGWHVLFVQYDVPDPTVVFCNDDTQQAMVFKKGIYAELMPLAELSQQIVTPDG